MKIKKTSLERDDISGFRRYVRKSRFNNPIWQQNLNDLETRLNTSKPGVVVIRSETSADTSVLDNTAAGKTDFVYYAADYYRLRGYTVLPFPDLRDKTTPNESFFHKIFIPELVRLTDNIFERLFTRLIICIVELAKCFIRRSILFLRTSFIAVILLLLFLLSAGFGAAKYFLEHRAEITQLIPLDFIRWLPFSLAVVALLGVLYVLGKIKEKHDEEWKSYAPKYGIEHALIDNANKTSSSKVLNRLKRCGRKTIIVIDDVEKCDNASIATFLDLEQQSQNSKHRLAIIFLLPSLRLQVTKAERSELLSEFESRRRGWLYITLDIPMEAEVRLLLWGHYRVSECDNIVDDICGKFPELAKNTALLLQFLYEVADILERENRKLETLFYEDITTWYEQFIYKYTNCADYVFSSIKESPLYAASKEFIKFMLAFQDNKAEKYVVDILMKDVGYQEPNNVAKLLAESGILETSEDLKRGRALYYTFVDPSLRNRLNLTWSEWREVSQQYKTKVFMTLFKNARYKIKEHPYLAKDCLPNQLVIDVLWREGDANWLYGGHADTNSALDYYGLENGALGKWLLLYRQDKEQDQVTSDTFYWRAEAPNSPYRFLKTSKSPRPYSFIGDLIETTVNLLLLSGSYPTADFIFGDLWPDVISVALSSPVIEEKIKRKLEEVDIRLKLLQAQRLYAYCTSPTDWQKAESLCETICAATEDNILKVEAQRVIWKIRYLTRYGIGNELSPLILIKTPSVDEFDIPAELFEQLDKSSDLDLLEIKSTHLSHYLEWALSEDGNKANVDDLLKYSQELLKDWLSSFKFISKPHKQTERTEGSELETHLLISQGVYSLLCGHFIRLWTKSFSVKPSQKWQRQDTGLRIRQFYEFCQSLRSFREAYTLNKQQKFTSSLESSWHGVESTYNGYLCTESEREARNWGEKIKDATNEFSGRVIEAFLFDSIFSLRLASQLASFSGLKVAERIAEYNMAIVVLDRASLSSNESRVEWHIDTIYQLEKELCITVGHALEGVKTHIHIARCSDNLRFMAHEYERAFQILSPVKNVPDVIAGELINNRLQALGNFGDITHPDEILSIAQQAHKVFIKCSEEIIPKEELDERKAHVRWWLAEAYARLAGENPINVKEYFEDARPHLNWIERHSQDNLQIKHFLPKSNQVRARFFMIQGEIKKAIEELIAALDYYRKTEEISDETRFLEKMQTLDMLVKVERTRLGKHVHDGAKITQKAVEKFYIWLDELKGLVIHASNKSKDKKLHVVTYLASLRATETVIQELLPYALSDHPRKEEFRNTTLDLWDFAITGYQHFGLYGKSAILAASLKTSGLPLPPDFNNTVHQAFYKWDPRFETTARYSVEQALRKLAAENIKVKEPDKDVAHEPSEAILNVRRLLSWEQPDISTAVSLLKAELPKIDEENPVPEHIGILHLLKQCYLVDGNLVEAKKIDEQEKRVTDTLSSKTYLELAEMFDQDMEIRERFLCMATHSDNQFARKARRILEQNYGKADHDKGEITRTEGDKLTHTRLMRIPVDEFDQETSYSLLLLFEIELRRLTGMLFAAKESEWWKTRIPTDVLAVCRRT